MGTFLPALYQGQGLLWAMGWMGKTQSCSGEKEMNSQKTVKEPVLCRGCETPSAVREIWAIHRRERVGFAWEEETGWIR